jgi:hypothetical protein
MGGGNEKALNLFDEPLALFARFLRNPRRVSLFSKRRNGIVVTKKLEQSGEGKEYGFDFDWFLLQLAKGGGEVLVVTDIREKL